jgi:ribulose-phosphate 3-epimerase
LNKKAAVVVNPGTPVEMVFPLLHMVEFVLMLTVNPGFGGQKFLPEVLPKIRTLSKKIQELGLDVGMKLMVGLTKKQFQLPVKQVQIFLSLVLNIS